MGFIKQNSGSAEYSEEIIHEIEQHAAEKEKGSKGVGGSAPDEVGDTTTSCSPPPLKWWWRPAWPPCPCSSGGSS